MVEDFPYEQLPEIRHEHLQLVRHLRAQVGPDAGEALGSWSRRFLGQASRSELQLGAILDPVVDGSLARLLEGGVTSYALRGPDGLEAVILLEPKLVSALRGLLLQAPPVPLVGAPTPAERGLIAFVLADLLHGLGADCAWTLLPQEPASPPGEVVGVEVRVVLGQLAGLAWLFVDSALLRRTCPPRRQRRSGRLGRLARLALRLGAEAGRLVLPAGELALLGEGDVILSPSCPPPGADGPRPGWLSVGGGGFEIVVEGDRATLTSRFRKGEPRMSPAKEAETDTLVEELPVELVVELGRVELTGAQVLELDLGDVLALERPLAGRVDLRVSGRLIARGELVNIDGEAGVRLVEVFDD